MDKFSRRFREASDGFPIAPNIRDQKLLDDRFFYVELNDNTGEVRLRVANHKGK